VVWNNLQKLYALAIDPGPDWPPETFSCELKRFAVIEEKRSAAEPVGFELGHGAGARFFQDSGAAAAALERPGLAFEFRLCDRSPEANALQRSQNWTIGSELVTAFDPGLDPS